MALHRDTTRAPHDPAPRMTRSRHQLHLDLSRKSCFLCALARGIFHIRNEFLPVVFVGHDIRPSASSKADGTAEALPFENNTFDLVVTRYWAHHWANVPKSGGVLRSNGYELETPDGIQQSPLYELCSRNSPAR
jgi:Methyltransferase domain